jgi:hypothetical protein
VPLRCAEAAEDNASASKASREEPRHDSEGSGTRKIFELLGNVAERFDEIRAAVEEMERGSEGVFDRLDRILTEKSGR